MAATYRAQFLGIMRELEQRMGRLFSGLAAAAAADIVRAAGEEGIIPLAALYELQAAIGLRVTRLFLGQSEGGRKPFAVLPDGTIYPLSPYSRTLFDGINAVEDLAVAKQQGVMVARFAGHEADLSRLRAAHVMFRNPLARYEPAHTWVDPNGYTLSERVWRTSGQTRRKLDMFLEERVRQGQGALRMSRDLETFLQPGRALKRTKAPYGTDASYDAMRLARTETTRAHAAAFEAAAKENPFVQGVEVVLSISHPKPDICDEAAAASPFPVDDIPEQYRIPLHPHCLCHYRNVLVENPAEVLAGLRANMGVPA